MLRILSLILSLMAILNCTAHQEGNFRTAPQNDVRREAFDRAHALLQIDERHAAKKALEKIIASPPVDDLTLDAVVLATDIYIVEDDFERASAVLSEFEKRAKRAPAIDMKRLEQAKFRLAHAVSGKAKQEPPKEDVVVKDEPIVIPENVSPAVEKRPSKEVERSLGILLPLSGHYELYGKRALAAMKLALNPDLEQKENGVITLMNSQGLKAYVIDTAGKSELASLGVDRLADEFHVGVVVGDILSDTASEIAKKCKERGIINITLAKKEGLTESNDSVFRVAWTAKKQAEALLSIADSLPNKKRYAILYPENHFGREMRDAFATVAKERNLEVVKQVGYKPDETTFTEVARQLVGPKQISKSSAYVECTEKANRIKDVSARKKAHRDCVDAAVPSVDFDALFIPELPRVLSYIIPALVAEGVLVSHNEEVIRAYRRTSRKADASPVQLLGSNSWNNESLGERLGIQLDGAIFVDSFDLKEQRASVKQFVDRFHAIVETPPVASEALAHDAVAIVKGILDSGTSEVIALDEVDASLRNLVMEGIQGKITFDRNRELVVPFRWFSFQNGKIVPRS